MEHSGIANIFQKTISTPFLENNIPSNSNNFPAFLSFNPYQYQWNPFSFENFGLNNQWNQNSYFLPPQTDTSPALTFGNQVIQEQKFLKTPENITDKLQEKNRKIKRNIPIESDSED